MFSIKPPRKLYFYMLGLRGMVKGECWILLGFAEMIIKLVSIISCGKKKNKCSKDDERANAKSFNW